MKFTKSLALVALVETVVLKGLRIFSSQLSLVVSWQWLERQLKTNTVTPSWRMLLLLVVSTKSRSMLHLLKIVLRYSSWVVAPITVNSPRERAGLRMSASPLEPLSPPVDPAPSIWWISSKKRIIFPASFTSLTRFWMFSSKLPRYWVPASRPEISMEIISLFLIAAGTSPLQ